MDRDDCCKCDPESLLVKAGNSFYVCPGCRPPAPAKEKARGKKALVKPAPGDAQQTLAGYGNGD